MDTRVIQIDELRDAMPVLRNWNMPLRMFYDETNNIRRLTLSEEGLNAATDGAFAIAGIAIEPEQELSGWEELRKAMRIQPSATEVKFKHIAPPDYEKVLASQKITDLLEWLLASNVYIHYSVLDLLHWSVIDIIDSLTGDDRLHVLPFHLELKNELYSAVRVDPAAFMSMLHGFGYPNLKRQDVSRFLEAVLLFVEQSQPNDRNLATTMLKQILKHAAKLPEFELDFLHDNKPGELIGNFSSQFMHCMYVFKHASHVFDRESYVEKVLQRFEIRTGEKRLDYRFADSKEEVGIQISDVIAGLLGRHFTYIRNHCLPELRNRKSTFSQIQRRNLELIRALINRSDAYSNGLFHVVLPLDTIFKNNVFLHECEAPPYME